VGSIRPKTLIVSAAAVLAIAAGLLAVLLLAPSSSRWFRTPVSCSLELDREPGPIPAKTPVTLTFVTAGISSVYGYEVDVDGDIAVTGTTIERRFSTVTSFTVPGLSTVTVTLSVDGTPSTFLFVLKVS
jgi:hypothetical protein